MIRKTHRLSIDLPVDNVEVLAEISERKGISYRQLVLQALRLYQLVDRRNQAGLRVYVENKDKTRTELELI